MSIMWNSSFPAEMALDINGSGFSRWLTKVSDDSTESICLMPDMPAAYRVLAPAPNSRNRVDEAICVCNMFSSSVVIVMIHPLQKLMTPYGDKQMV